MSDPSISQQITDLANAYDPVREFDALASRALLQGTFAGLAMLGAKEGVIGACKVDEVIEQGVDADGNYRPYFTIVTGAGHRVRVSFEVE